MFNELKTRWQTWMDNITWFHGIRIGMCIAFTYVMLDFVLKYMIAVQAATSALHIYNIATVFKETGMSEAEIDLTTGVIADGYLVFVAWYFVITTIALIAIWKWWGIPNKILIHAGR